MSIGPIGRVTADLWRAGNAGGTAQGGPSSPASGSLAAPRSLAAPAIGAGGIDTAPGGTTSGAADSFLDTIGAAAARLNADLVSADAAMATFAAGGSADLHTVVLQMQEASLQLKLGVQIRDRLLEAYQDIMRLQV